MIPTDVPEALARARADLERDGYLVWPSLLNRAEVDTLRTRVTSIWQSARPRSRQVLYVNGEVPPDTLPLDALLHQWLNPHRLPPGEGTADLLTPVEAAAAALLQGKPLLFQDLLLVKTPEQSRFPWHQDFPFWPVDRPQGLVCWMPLVDNVEAGGGLSFARGSHRDGLGPAIDLHRGTAQDPSALLAFDPARWPLDCPALSPGDAVFFTPLTWHASGRRTTDGRRAAWSSVWLHPSVCWHHARAPAHPICQETEDGSSVRRLTNRA